VTLIAVLVAAGSAAATVFFLAREPGITKDPAGISAAAVAPPAPPPVAEPRSLVSTTPVAMAAAVAAPAPSPSARANDGEAPRRGAAMVSIEAESPSVQGVTDTEIRFGIVAPFTGPAKEMGHQLRLGIDTAFAAINDNGGVNGRQLKLVAADDGYEPTQTLAAMQGLYENNQVFGFIDNYGSPTALVSVPYALEHHAIFFGAFSGAKSLRHDPPDRYVFNFRAGYAEEADAVVRYLVKIRRVPPEQIAVLTQQDAFGDAGMEGVTRAIRALRGNATRILRMTYNRNSLNLDDALALLRQQRSAIKAVVLIATFRPAAKFIERTRDAYPGMIYATISGVGSTGLADELKQLGPRFSDGVIVTQVVPAVDSYASVSLVYKKALAKYHPDESPDYTSLESYLTASVLIEGLRRAGPQINTETLVDTLESMHDIDLGLGPRVSFGLAEHQALHKIWGTELDQNGQYHSLSLE
jgi:ABC-type branched-subunit amino acid transport system substrate-binding protein